MKNLQQTLVIWWRFGKEHGEKRGFRLNPPAVIEQHWDTKVAQARQTPSDQWRWWSEGNLVVERPDAHGYGYGPDTRIYYLVERGLTVVENIHLSGQWASWPWYIHLADIFYDTARNCWISQDLFCDILLPADGQRYHVTDLADLGRVLQLGLLSAERAATILARTDQTLAAIVQGHFPFPEIAQARQLCRQLGW